MPATRLVRDDAYEEMAAAYQCVLLAALDEALEVQGVAKKTRRKVCETFLFNLGNFHDQGWLRPTADAAPVYPLLCFTTTFLNTDTPVNRLGPVYAPSSFFAFHEYAFGCVEVYFGGDPAARVETGC